MTPWDYLQHHSQYHTQCHTQWLTGTSQSLFQSITASYYQTLTHLPPHQTIVLAEPDPIKFLAFWVAAASTPHRLVLANPQWQSHEWQQVYTQIQPDITIGPAPSQTRIHPHPKAIDRLPPQVTLIPTGGSSGQIKFAVHTWDTLQAAALGLQEYFAIPQINSCCVLPLHHVSGLMQAIRSLITQGQLTLHPWKSLTQGILPTVPPHSFLSLVPTQLTQLLDRDTPAILTFLRQFHAIFLGGAPAWDSLLDRARQHQLPIAPTYGMTETAGQIATLKPADFLAGHTGCGQVLPHAKITANGPIHIQARSLMLGYFPVQDFTIDDLGHFDDRGSLHIQGRNSTKIISGGENIFPAEVEAAIRATGLVRDVVVIGLPDDRWGQTIAAAIVPAHPSFQIADLQIALRDRLTAYKHPKQWRILAHIPRNPQGKIATPTLKSWFHPS